MKLSQDQENALNKVLDFLQDPDIMEMAIEGHSGTGKSTLTKHILEAADAQAELLSVITNSDNELQIELTATTNKAAEVLAEKTKRDATTIHKLLGLRLMVNYKDGGTYLKQTGNPQFYKNTLIVVDEASMENTELLERIRGATDHCKVLHIGDPYQLAPVRESSCPLFDTIDHKVKLTEIMRNAGPIADLGEQFRQTLITGVFPDIVLNGKELIHTNGEQFQAMVNNEFNSVTHDFNQAKILAWTNNMVNNYNDYCRSLYTPSKQFILGEQLVTNKPILINTKIYASTDEIVKITEVGKETTEMDITGTWYTLNHQARVFVANNHADVTNAMKAAKANKAWSDYYGMQEFFADLRPLHSSTVHKSQGSTYGTVYIDLDDIGKCHDWSDVARMLYVAITRASAQVVFYGNLPHKYTSAYGSHLT